MKSNRARVLGGIAVVVVAVVLLIVLKDDGSDSGESSSGGTGNVAAEGEGPGRANPATAAVPTIVVEGGKPVGGVRTLTYKEGDQIRFAVESDISEEIHVHGYDLAKEVRAGGSVRFDFPASLEGVFEAELEERGVQIAELIVNP
jgi:hypothetical protein